MADFELLKVSSAAQLYENLEKLMKNKKHIESIHVDKAFEEIRVDLSRLANGFGNPDFKLKLRSGKSMEAEALLNRLKNADSVSRSQAEELYEMLYVGPN